MVDKEKKLGFYFLFKMAFQTEKKYSEYIENKIKSNSKKIKYHKSEEYNYLYCLKIKYPPFNPEIDIFIQKNRKMLYYQIKIGDCMDLFLDTLYNSLEKTKKILKYVFEKSSDLLERSFNETNFFVEIHTSSLTLNSFNNIIIPQKNNNLKFNEKESFKHKLAKELLKKWLIEQNGDIDPLYFNSNRQNGEGIMLEYPVVYAPNRLNYGSYTTDHFCIWDEIKKGDSYIGFSFEGTHPTVQQCFDNKLDVICVLDIALAHKGQIRYGIEVIHKNDISNKKRNIFRKLIRKSTDISFYSISADWILNQIKTPEKLKIKKII